MRLPTQLQLAQLVDEAPQGDAWLHERPYEREIASAVLEQYGGRASSGAVEMNALATSDVDQPPRRWWKTHLLRVRLSSQEKWTEYRE